MDKVKKIMKAAKEYLFLFIDKLRTLDKKTQRIIIAVLVGVITFSGCLLYINRDKSMVKVCESSIDYNKGIGLTFYVGKDGKTIEKIEKNDTVSLDFIKANLTDDEESSKKILAEYKDNAKFYFDETVEKYKDVSWFSSNLESKDEYIKATYTFNVASKDFNFEKYKNILEEFSLQYYFNKDKNKFIYDEGVLLSEKTPLGTIEKVGCHDMNEKITVVDNENNSDKIDKTKEEKPE